MENQNNNDRIEAEALQRYAWVIEIKNLTDQTYPLSLAVAQVAEKTQNQLEGPISYRTLEDWWYLYKNGGFAALKPKPRKDRGIPRKLTLEQQQRLLDTVRAQPAIPVKVHYRQLKSSDPTFPSLATVHRFLNEQGLGRKKRRELITQKLSGPTKAWESPAANDLWMVDFSPGPSIHLLGQPKAVSSQLCAIIDDHSRVVVCARYATLADTQAFHSVLKEALRRRGIPRALYADNGGPFVNDHTRMVSAQLGIRLLHARPRHAWSKGKIERWFQTAQQDFEARLKLPGQAPTSFEELNHQLAFWLQEYHTRIHSTTGETPEARFARHAQFIHSLDPKLELDRLFYAQEERVVRKDGTIRLDSDWYEVPLSLRGLKIRLRFDPWTKARVEIDHRGQSFGLARKLDRQLNGTTFGGQTQLPRL